MTTEFDYKGHTIKVDYGCEIDGGSSYEDFLVKLNPLIEWHYAQENDYQGEWFAVGNDGEQWYFHQGSFGSCSGCDWLQSIDTQEGAIEFLKAMEKIVPIGRTK